MQYICLSLDREGFKVIGTTNAEEALELADREQPDLIISDVKMPIMDGVEFCWMIRENSKIPMVPFVFLTGYDDDDLQINGFRAGADAYLLKPVQRSKLLNIVASLINRYKSLQEMGAPKGSGVSGNTDEISTVEILQFLSTQIKTGVFRLVQNNIEGKIYMKEGKIINAEFADLDGMEAVNMIIMNMEGDFYFDKVNVDVEDIIKVPTIKLLMEASRIIDEANKNQ
jgi:DNA-binding response OmpR family regulator